jgi:Arc/MetJ family transcription regulator
MRTTVVLNDKLLKKAQDALGTSTIRETVERALEEAIRAQGRRELLAMLGNFELNLTHEDLERRRNEDEHRRQWDQSRSED